MQENVNKKLIKCVSGNIYFQYITYLIDKPTDTQNGALDFIIRAIKYNSQKCRT